MTPGRGGPGPGVLLGIDIGTYASKGVACLPGGEVLAEATLAHGISTPAPGHVEQDADGVWWSDLEGICHRLIAEVGASAEIAAVSITTTGPCLLPVDAGGHPLRPGILYGVDVRAAEQIASLEARLGRRAIRSLGRMDLSSQAVGPKITWLAEREPEVYAATARFHTATSYLVFRLTGTSAIDGHQACYFTPFYGARRREWDLRNAGGLDLARRLPPIRWATEIAGLVTADAAARTGLPAGTPVLVGTSDGPTEAASVGALRPGVAALTYGSTTTITTFRDGAGPARGLWESEGIILGQRMLGGGLSTSGAITSWLRREFARELPQGSSQEIADAHAVLVREAAASGPGANGLLLLPYFSGERTPFADPLARGTIAGLALSHTRGDVSRAILEGTALGVRQLLDALAAAGAGAGRIRVAGGGTRSRLAMQIVSDATSITQEVPAVTIGAAYGAAYLAALATGLVGEGSRPDGWVRIVDRIVPDATTDEAYRRRYDLFRRLYRDTAAINHELAAGASAAARQEGASS
jgi:xylulokinase